MVARCGLGGEDGIGRGVMRLMLEFFAAHDISDIHIRGALLMIDSLASSRVFLFFLLDLRDRVGTGGTGAPVHAPVPSGSPS